MSLAEQAIDPPETVFDISILQHMRSTFSKC
jgi:hypothetical protein